MNDDNSLDAFLTEDTSTDKKNKNIEDEFAQLLNAFISQDKMSGNPENKKTEDSLDSFLTSPVVSSGNASATQLQQDDSGKESSENNAHSVSMENLSEIMAQTTVTTSQNTQDNDTASNKLKQEEQELARAVANFQDGIMAMADKKNLKLPDTDYEEDMLYPNYKPSIGKKIAQYLLACWDIMNKYDPENMKRLSKDAGDEEYLVFAETLNDTDMQLAIISYVEILINLEICEVSYEQKKEILQKNRIKRELYDEYMGLQERKALFIKKLKEKNFPINADRLIGNYFRVAQKDPDGSYNALVKNPAMFSPIEFEKIRPKFFGLIKVTPEDGIKANQKIGRFIKKLKV